ncbi:MAG: transposase [Muribaculaceae bacterium]|nr:transposase [Muribaculaceae bacterium]
MNNRKTPRAEWHDYNGGLYFVTVVTRNREQSLGTIENGVMRLSVVGCLLEEQIQSISRHFPYVVLDRYVIMPNHFHLLIYIDKDKANYKMRSPQSVDGLNQQQGRNDYFKDVAALQGALSVVIGGIKSWVSRNAHKQGADFGWQTRFHDHIVRGREDWMNIADYIEHNVEKWGGDMFNPDIEA